MPEARAIRITDALNGGGPTSASTTETWSSTRTLKPPARRWSVKQERKARCRIEPYLIKRRRSAAPCPAALRAGRAAPTARATRRGAPGQSRIHFTQPVYPCWRTPS